MCTVGGWEDGDDKATHGRCWFVPPWSSVEELFVGSEDVCCYVGGVCTSLGVYTAVSPVHLVLYELDHHVTGRPVEVVLAYPWRGVSHAVVSVADPVAGCVYPLSPSG